MTRSAADIGAGLAPIRAARSIRPGERIHVLGIAGAGASAAALLARAAGARVSGCDPGGPSPYTPALEAAGIPVAAAHDAAHLRTPDRPDRLAVTKALTAVDPDQPELGAARAAGIPVEPWQQVVADAAFGRRLVAVAGTHGKSTTAGWLVHVLVAAGADPSAFVGALLPASLTGGVPATARRGGGDAFVVEADEYAGNFEAYRPGLVILTNVDWDHPDVFADRAAVELTIADWLERAAEDRDPGDPLVLVATLDDAGVRAVLGRVRHSPIRVVPVGLDDPAAEFRAVVVGEAADGTDVEVVVPGSPSIGPLRLRTAGRHNVTNALGVLAAAVELGVDPERALGALATFEGVGRRLERKGEAGGVTVYDDYGHHPTAIAATIAAVRQREPGRRLWVACEPLTFHRTRAMLDGLAAALIAADGVLVADIWAGRDRPVDRAATSPADVAAAVIARRPAMPAEAPGSVEATADRLAELVRPGDAVLVMGGGRSYRIGERLLERLGAGGGGADSIEA